MYKSNIKFSKDDCGILFSVPNNCGGGNLADIIGLSDAMNTGIPSETMMRIALTKGVQSGLVHYQGGKFYPSEYLWRIKEQIINVAHDVFSFIELLYEELGSRDYEKITDQQVNFFTGEYKLACSISADLYWNGNYVLRTEKTIA